MIRWRFHTSNTARLCMGMIVQNRHLFVSWNYHPVSNDSQLEAKQAEQVALPLRSNVIADASTNTADTVKADLKNIMMRR